MTYTGVYPSSTEFPNPLYPIIGLIFCGGLYCALFQSMIQKIIENLFSLTSNFGHIERTIIYLFLINFPLIFLALSSLIYNHSLIGFQISCDADHLQILLLSGYICYVEESRQTPICGFLFIRDLVMAIGCLSCLLKIYLDGKFSIQYGLVLAGLYFIYYVTLQFEQKLEDGLLRLLKLRGHDVFNSVFLQTKTTDEVNYFELKELIDENKQQIDIEINEFRNILSKVIINRDEQTTLLNFARLFIPYKHALCKREELELKRNIEAIEEDWPDDNATWVNEIVEEEEQMSIEQFDKFNSSNASIMNRKTMTEDFVIEQTQDGEKTLGDRIMKCIFFPIYFFSTFEGRVRHLLDYLALTLMCGCMWMIANSAAYFVESISNYSFSFVSLFIALIIISPSSRYYFRISAQTDFDFINIFLQSSIIKSVIFGITVTILAFVSKEDSCAGNIGLMISSLIGIVTYVIFGIFIVSKKYATLRSNFKFFFILSVCSFIIRIVAEVTLNATIA